MKKIVILFILCFSTTSFAAAPKVLFSDMTDAPVTGWEGSSTKGAAVSIWGLNFGTSRGASYVTIAGQNLTSSSDYAEWGATTNPTTARGLQRITFWLNSSMSLGDTTISVTTSEGTSQTVPFYTRNTGNIYFVSTSGNDNNNGQTVATAWRHPYKARGTLNAGDAAYFKAGVYNSEDHWDSVIMFKNDSAEHAIGVANNSATFTSYPGEVAQLGDNTRQYVIRHQGYTPADRWNYWTFSKFIMRSSENTTNFGMDGPGTSTHVRFIGNDISTTLNGQYGLLVEGQSGLSYLYLYGNYIHDLGVDTRGQTASRQSYPIYLAGYGPNDHIYVGWNELAYNSFSRGMQVYGHLINDTMEYLYVHDNSIHDNALTGIVFGGGDGGSYYTYLRHSYFYNNIVYHNGLDTSSGGWSGIFVGGGLSWGGPSEYLYIYNNTFYDHTWGCFQNGWA